ncbi:sialate O-acetylesterase [Stenotrophomonas sp.]|uniref:sialate O-acetylesterase n=1 Tax=Stenotrophomonas sp. TaxID=69392 RepID=UPI0028AF7DF1|nr:sialate O-acetylesterase [Stenotrophomonas sp.]
MKHLYVLAPGLAALLAAGTVRAAPVLPLLFSDGAVLQRDQPLPVWGTATPGAQLTVRLDGRTASATTDAGGRWQVLLPAHAAGGPFELQVEGDGGALQVRDVLFGDVWLASGQSNMEWPLHDTQDAAAAVAAADDGQLRQFKVPKSWSGEPERTLAGGQWKAATPANAGTFSAVGYYFARDLRAHLGVPIGIIDSTWGGSTIEAWMPAALQGVDARALATRMQARKAQDAQTLAEVRQRLARWTGVDEQPQWAAPDHDTRDWVPATLPGLWETTGYAGMDGVGWYRATFTLSAAQARQGGSVGVGRIDDSDRTYVNGVQIGATAMAWNTPRVYPVAAGHWTAGRNVVAVRVEDFGGGGGIHGQDDELFVRLADGSRVPLQDWRFHPGKVTVALDDDKNQTATLLYNRMIHPLPPFPVKGVIWYQGESNATNSGALAYRDQFKALIEQWRRDWSAPALPFVWVQLASFGAGEDHGDESPWAVLRESQSAALSLPKTAQVVTIDIGNASDIHPRNKRDVGARLALAARHVAYGETGVFSGPVRQAVRFDGDQAVVAFNLHGSALAVRGGGTQVQGFMLAGADRRFHPAQGRIEGDRVIVRSAAVAQPVAVRYAWRENPADADLINSQQLPASPFRSDTW